MIGSQGPHPLPPSPAGTGADLRSFPDLRRVFFLPSIRASSSPFRGLHAQLARSSLAMHSSHQKEHLYKILVIGDLGVGKTSIIKRYVHHNFSPNYRATIGVDFALKVLSWDQETVRLQLWDIAGNLKFNSHLKPTLDESELGGCSCCAKIWIITVKNILSLAEARL